MVSRGKNLSQPRAETHHACARPQTGQPLRLRGLTAGGTRLRRVAGAPAALRARAEDSGQRESRRGCAAHLNPDTKAPQRAEPCLRGRKSVRGRELVLGAGFAEALLQAMKPLPASQNMYCRRLQV